MIAPTMGTAATISAVRPEARCCSAVVSKIHGIAISTIAKANTYRQCANAARIAPARRARSISTIAANDVLPNTTTGGSNSLTATRIRKYGMPHMNAIAVNRIHPRFVTARPPVDHSRDALPRQNEFVIDSSTQVDRWRSARPGRQWRARLQKRLQVRHHTRPTFVDHRERCAVGIEAIVDDRQLDQLPIVGLRHLLDLERGF